MKHIFILFTFLIATHVLFSQIDSANYSQIFNQESKLDAIARNRNLIMDHVLDNNKSKVRDLFNYATLQLENDNYIALYPVEKWLISIWLNDYFYIVSDIVNSDSVTYNKLNKKVKPNEDQLYRVLMQVICDNKPEYETKIKSSEQLTTEDQEFFLLTLAMYCTYSESTQQNQESINRLSDLFLNDFPSSKYEAYIRNYYRYEYVPKNFKFGMEFFIGSGIVKGKTEEYFSSGFAVGLGFIWGYNNFNFNTRATILINKLKKDIHYNGTIWPGNDASSSVIPELSLDYKFKLRNKLSISPILGLSWFLNSPSEEDRNDNEQLKDVRINSKVSPVFGFDFAWDFKNIFYYNYVYSTNMHLFSSFNIRYTYQPVNFKTSYNYLNGSVHNISISYKFGFGGAKRVY